VERYRATAELPFVHLHEATSLLRTTLSRALLDDGMPGPDWSTFRVLGPVEVFDARGRIAYEYRGSVEPRRPRALPNIRPRDGGRLSG
jgi:hypothetical protein